LTQWLKGKSKMSFAIPMVWQEPKDHSTVLFLHDQYTGSWIYSKEQGQDNLP
jgi:hypothetical protein